MDKSNLLRLAGVLFGGFKAIIALRELVTRPDRDVWIETIGSVVSLHSVYWGLAFVAGGIMIASSWRAIRWALAAPQRARERKEARQESDRQRIVNIATGLQEALKKHNTNLLSGSEKLELWEQIDLFGKALEEAGFGVKGYELAESDINEFSLWEGHVSRLMPYLRINLDLARRKLTEWQKPKEDPHA